MRFLLWVLVLWWGVTLLRRAVTWMLRGVVNSTEQEVGPENSTAEPTRITSGRLVRDPVCGVHIAEDRAIAFPQEAGLLHFCSTACRDQYVENGKRLAHG